MFFLYFFDSKSGSLLYYKGTGYKGKLYLSRYLSKRVLRFETKEDAMLELFKIEEHCIMPIGIGEDI